MNPFVLATRQIVSIVIVIVSLAILWGANHTTFTLEQYLDRVLLGFIILIMSAPVWILLGIFIWVMLYLMC